MKNITTKQFQILTDINLVWDFMVDSFGPNFSNGVWAPFFEYAITSSWMCKDYTYRNRIWLDGDKVVAFVFHEGSATDVYFNLRPGYEELADEMVEYAKENMPNFDNEQQFILFRGQSALIEAAKKYGYELAYEYDDMIFNLNQSELNHELPEGFHFVNPADVDPVKLGKCCWSGFDHDSKGPFENLYDRIVSDDWTPQRAFNGILSSTMANPPHSTYEYDVIIANEKDEYVCYSGMWWVPQNKLAYMEPLCTIPEYRKMGLAAAALTKHYRQMKPLGAEVMTGGNNEFYKKLGYEPGIHWMHFKRK